MTSIEVVVRGSLIGETVRLRPYLTKATEHTRISLLLAERLGLTEFRDIFVKSKDDERPIQWKVSVFPIKIWCREMQERRALSIYPLVNTSPQGAYYEMIGILSSSSRTLPTTPRELTIKLSPHMAVVIGLKRFATWLLSSFPSPGCQESTNSLSMIAQTQIPYFDWHWTKSLVSWSIAVPARFTATPACPSATKLPSSAVSREEKSWVK